MRYIFIKALFFLAIFLAVVATRSDAGELTPAERTVCESLRVCADIIRRHDADEFDYSVLEKEFRRFGPVGRAALFTILQSEDGHPDIARLISALGPLTARERLSIQKAWTPAKSASYLPLLLDAHPQSRNLLLRTLGHDHADVRETARIALIRLPQATRNAPIPDKVQSDVLAALQVDPIDQAAPYLARFNAAGHEAKFVALLGSGSSDIVTASYRALYRNNPAQAFNGLLGEMNRMNNAAQSRAVGDMLASRHRSRPDGFYQKFARDVSGDEKLSVAARASGLHSLLMIADGPFPDLTAARSEAFSFILKGQPFAAQDQYLPYLGSARAEGALELIWAIAQDEKWINRDKISAFYTSGHFADKVTVDLLKANDLRSFSAGLERVKPAQMGLVRAKTDHPIAAIANAARQKLKLSGERKIDLHCPLTPFDIEDMRAQMPFFEGGWMIAHNSARTSLPRNYLTSAHPTTRGWLAGYDLSNTGPQSRFSGGAILHYDNRSGVFQRIAEFDGPKAILPDRLLQLGQTTDRFWIVDSWGDAAPGVSVSTLDISGDRPRVNHIDSLPDSANAFSVAANGDLMVIFNDEYQSPIRLSKSGQMSLACRFPLQVNVPRAEQ